MEANRFKAGQYYDLYYNNDEQSQVAPEYWVFFFHEDPNEDEEEIAYRRESYRITGASSVLEAIEWEKSNAYGCLSATALPIPGSNGATPYILHGHYPDVEYVRDIIPDFGWTINMPAPPLPIKECLGLIQLRDEHAPGKTEPIDLPFKLMKEYERNR